MDSLVRRSNLVVPFTAHQSIREAWRQGADAVTLDLRDGIPEKDRAQARSLIKESIAVVARGGAEVFVRVNKPSLYLDVEASVWPGLSGILLPQAEHAGEVGELAALLERLERSRGLQVGSLQVIALLESALGIWNVREIIKASPRVTQVAQGEAGLCRDLDIVAVEELDPFVFARGRMVVEATAAGVQPVGLVHPLGALPRVLPGEEMLRLATISKDLGLKGALCPYPSWVQPVNAAFSPTEAQVAYYTEVRQVFAEGVARGTAAVPLRGRMIDVPVDEWAKKVLERAAQCRARDQAKERALAQVRAQ